jgi:hypothetical protein
LHHHRPEEAKVHPDLVHLVYLADLIMSRFMPGHEMERVETDTLGERIKTLGLNTSQFAGIVDGIPRQVFDDRLIHASN